MSAEHKFQVNLRGVIDLLSNHLYSGPQVYVRELLQNAVDALVARRHLEPTHTGSVSLELVRSADGKQSTLAVQDDGIGLTEEEIHRFLATIGQSSKRESLQRDDFIGQFGIGLLSCFVVCNEIVVITRSAVPGSRAVEWRGRSDGTYALRVLEHDGEPGTQVYLRAKPGCQEFFEPAYVVKMARHFGGLLPYAITVSAGSEQWSISETPPWRQRFADESARQEAYLAFGRELFGTEFFDAIPLRSEIGGVEGIAFVLPSTARLAAKRTHRVYLKDMLLSESADNLLPEWAFFVKCVINASDLRPTASRESFYEDDNLAAARGTLGQCLRRYLLDLADRDPGRLDRLIGMHFLAMKALALEDDEFFSLFIDLLPFETSLGEMTLREYLEHEPVVRYVPTRDQFRQISSVAAAQSMCVINGGYTYDSELLEKLPRLMPRRRVERVDASHLSENFADLTRDERARTREFVKRANQTLRPFHCAVQLKKFEPTRLPALFTASEDATFLRSLERSQEQGDELWSSVLGKFAEKNVKDGFAQLCLNYRNRLVRKMTRVADRDLVQRSLEMLYVQALLLGHYPLKSRELKLLNEGLLGLIECGIDGSGEEPE